MKRCSSSLEPGVHLARRIEFKMTDRASVVADFWLAVARNNLEEAQNAVRRLDVPVVSVSSAYSFEMVEGEERPAEVEQEDTAGREEGGDHSVDSWDVD